MVWLQKGRSVCDCVEIRLLAACRTLVRLLLTDHGDGEEKDGEEFRWRAGLLARVQARSGNEGGNQGKLRAEGEADIGGEEGGQQGSGGE